MAGFRLGVVWHVNESYVGPYITLTLEGLVPIQQGPRKNLKWASPKIPDRVIFF